MSSLLLTRQSATLFERAIQRGIWKRMKRKLLHQPTDLIDFDEWKHRHTVTNQVDRGIDAIPIREIVGSLSRINKFDRDFLPMNDGLELRWRRILCLILEGINLPPIDVYRTHDGYYVIDGHHRVSVSRFLGIEYIDAHVIELKVVSTHLK